MSRLSTRPSSNMDAKINAFLDTVKRRDTATPPGVCPVAVTLSHVETCASQTCGKCVPCRDGLPQLALMLRDIRDCKADAQTIRDAKALAEVIRDSSDCAIGYKAATDVLEAFDLFADEFESHISKHMCTDDISQKVPCEALCPAHVNVPAYIALVGEGRYADAINMIRKDNPFPTMCALVCEHPCELRCRRNLIDSPVNIRGIKKFAVDSCAANTVAVPKRLTDSGRKIAVIGGGPSGLTCAYFSALMGHKVTVFEAHKSLGGMTRYGIPAYRFPRERLDEDIEAVLSVGNIEVKLETCVDAHMMTEIAKEYDAVYVAVGAQTGKSLNLENVNAHGVFSAVEMLGKIGDGDYPDFMGKRVAVIGGGNVAMDCCRTAIRANAQEVTCVYRRRLEDMSAHVAEIESAMQEGVEMMTLEAPDSIEVDENGNVAALITQPQYISAVRGGRPAPVAADKPKKRLECDIILLAVGQDIVSGPFEEFGLKTERGRFVASDTLDACGYSNIFVGGDCQTGPATVIKAIGAGKVAARNIDEFMGYHHKLPFNVEVPEATPNNRTAYGRVDIKERPARERKHDFDYVEEPMSREEAVQECGRCLRCDKYGCGVLVDGRYQHA